VVAQLRFSPELAHENGLLRENPLNLISVFGIEFIPAEVFILANDVECVAEWIVHHSLVAIGLRSEHG
jgi:hypothetical protein